MSLNTLDIILLICFIPAFIQGLRKGFAGQIISILTLIIGAYLSFRFSDSVSKSLAPSFQNVDLRLLRLLSFVLIFSGVSAALWALGRFLQKLIDITTLGWLNRILGMFFSVFATALVLALIFSVTDGFNDRIQLIKPETLQGSQIYLGIKNFAARVFPYLEAFFKNVNV